MNTLQNQYSEADVIAYVDEAGSRGFSRNLKPERDNELGLFCALVFPAERIDAMRSQFAEGYNRFIKAMPPGSTPHITDAFEPGKEAWAAVARTVRDEFFTLICELQIGVIYEARRLKVDRTGHERTEALRDEAQKSKQSTIKISARPSSRRVEEWLMIGLALKLNALVTDLKRNRIDLRFDEIDDAIADLCRQAIERTKNVGYNETTARGWDPATKSKVEGKIIINAYADVPLDATHIGDIDVAGKQDPLMLATDIVANALYHHLTKLPKDAHLNRPSSLAGWELKDRVYGARDDAIEDLI